MKLTSGLYGGASGRKLPVANQGSGCVSLSGVAHPVLALVPVAKEQLARKIPHQQ